MTLFFDIDDLDNRDPAFLDAMCGFVERVMVPYHRAEVSGLDRVPTGAALYVGNHSGAMMTPDTFLLGAALYRAHGLEALPYGLGHTLPLSIPGINAILAKSGAVRASDDNAARLFERGEKVLVYPGGDIDAMRPFRERHRIKFGGRVGYIRTALRNRVPIIPVVSEGTHAALLILDDLPALARAIGAARFLRIKVWPLALSVPWGLTLGPPTLYWPLPVKIRIEVLAPIHFERLGEEAASDEEYVRCCDELVRGRMQEALDHLARLAA